MRTSVHAFEWCDCIYESGFSVVSLHATKLGAYRAMKDNVYRAWDEDRRFEQRVFGKTRAKPLRSKAWRVRTYEVQT